MSSCCGGNCGCGAGCKCGTGCSGCKMYPEMMSSYSESTTTATAATNTLVFGVAPLTKPIFEGSAVVGENGGGCKYCGTNSCTCN